MKENKCCGNVDSSYVKDMDSFCVREFLHKFEVCNEDSDHHTRINYGWTEITPDNVDDIRKNKKSVVIINPKEWDAPEMCYGIPKETLVLYSEWGGYYYYVLPELKIE